jgi:hypothetical protein
MITKHDIFCLVKFRASVQLKKNSERDSKVFTTLPYRKKNRIDKFCFENFLTSSGLFTEEKLLSFQFVKKKFQAKC